ncbi:hypothetical protein BpHYR1_010813 [Brachionus plicatilis]|uniref:Uncharacterized protein n=1 Tax=Brachionus plicatilis TaxID=10195 RepID=A0A3M7QHF5_BRAPC|nr:hypothetical protein BpHYR1_010813 [Brachionus plicatilis]
MQKIINKLEDVECLWNLKSYDCDRASFQLLRQKKSYHMFKTIFIFARKNCAQNENELSYMLFMENNY